MKKFILIAALMLMPFGAMANPFYDFEGNSNIIAVFAPRDLDSRLYKQVNAIRANYSELKKRDITVVRVIQGREVELYPTLSRSSLGRDLPDEPGQAYSAYDIELDDFGVVVLDKDGDVVLQSDSIVDGKKIAREIDRMADRKAKEQK